MSERVQLFSDGACKYNPGIGGWGVVLRRGDFEKELYGSEKYTTNNRMELKAVIEGLSTLKNSCEVDVYTDSRYVQQGMTSWLELWKKRNWRTAGREPVANQDLWIQLEKLAAFHKVEWHWVKAHTGHPENERADTLANLAIQLAQKK